MQCFFPLLVVFPNFEITVKILLLLWYVHFMEVDDYAENIHLIFEVDTPTYNTLIWGWYYLGFFWFVLTSQMDLGTEVEQ